MASDLGSGFANAFWHYKGIIETMEANPGMYHLDRMRSEAHKKLEEYFDASLHENLKEVLHDLEPGDQPKYIENYVKDIEGFREFRNKWRDRR